MDNVSQRQQFKIDAMHGHDMGVWVCEGSGLALSPVLFMQAVCPAPAPRQLLVKWKSAAVPPKAFQKEGALPLVYADCGRLPPWPYYLHLFAPQAPVARAVEQATGLQDWAWAVPVVGIILIFNEQYDRPPSRNRLFGRSSSSQPKTPSAWAQEQRVSCVVAALGYTDTPASIQQFRNLHDLAADVPVMPGPALFDARPRGQDAPGGTFSSVFGRRELAFDRDYARTVLDELLQKIEHER